MHRAFGWKTGYQRRREFEALDSLAGKLAGEVGSVPPFQEFQCEYRGRKEDFETREKTRIYYVGDVEGVEEGVCLTWSVWARRWVGQDWRLRR